jgi:hypothetical protein
VIGRGCNLDFKVRRQLGVLKNVLMISQNHRSEFGGVRGDQNSINLLYLKLEETSFTKSPRFAQFVEHQLTHVMNNQNQ